MASPADRLLKPAHTSYGAMVPEQVSNPYWFDQSDQDRCAICGTPITQLTRGPARVFCARSECRRTGAMNRRLANAWTEGFKAGAQGKLIVTQPPPPPKKHMSTAFQAGAEAAKRDALDKLRWVQSSLDGYRKERPAESFSAVKATIAALRESLRLGVPTAERQPGTRR